MSDQNGAEKEVRTLALGLVDRASEMLFGLFMALTFTGAISVATAGRQEIHTMYAAALAGSVGWGLVDAIMYLVRAFILDGHSLRLAESVRDAADPAAGRALIERSLPAIAGAVSPAELEAIRQGLVVSPLPERPSLMREDLLAAAETWGIVVMTTLFVMLPYALIGDVRLAKLVSRAVALTMLFLGGVALGRYAGYRGWRAGFIMVALGSILVCAIVALGG